MTAKVDTEGRPHIRGLPIPKTRTFGGAGSLNLIGTNIMKAQRRGLPLFDRPCVANSAEVSICGGGPTLEDTYDQLKGRIVCVNGAHDFLLKRGVVPHACVLLCPVDYLLDAFEFTPHPDVQYFVASLCHDRTFDRLNGMNVVLWHASQPSPVAIDALLPKGTFQVGGGGFVSLRCIHLSYFLGFRRHHYHGFDSSYRRAVGGGMQHHAYNQERDDPGSKEPEIIDGFPTFLALHAQVADFFRTIDAFEGPGYDPFTFTLYGDGLLQHSWRKHTGSLTYTTQPGRDQSAPQAAA